MRSFLAVLAAVTTVACVGATEPRNQYCTAVGDTLTYTAVIWSTDSTTIDCRWQIETQARCFPRPFKLYGQADCMIGEKWPRR